MRRNRHFKKNIIGLKGNEGETIFTPSAQAELLKNFYSSIFGEVSEYVEWPARRSCYGFICEDVQNQARGPPKNLPRRSPE